MSTFFDISKLRFIQESEVDYDSPGTEELFTQVKENQEALFHLLLFTGSSGTATTAPSSEEFWDANSTWASDVHNGRTLVILSGAAAGKYYTIDDTISGATSTGKLIMTGDDLAADGVASGDKYKVLYNLQNSTGHTHDDVNSPRVVLADDQVTQAKVADSAIGQAQLKTTTASQNVSVSPSSAGTINLTGGGYSWPGWSADGSGDIVFGGGSPAVGRCQFYNNNVGSSVSAYVYSRYVQASPPYDLGDGEVLMFIYVVVGKDGSLKGISVAPDPIWAHNGPTCIVPEYYRNGKPYRKYKELAGMPFDRALRDEKLFDRYMKGEIGTERVEREITHEIKNRDMDIIPHPYDLNDWKNEDVTAIILDPVSPIMERLAEIQREVGSEEVFNLIQKGYLKFDNERLSRKGPKALMPVSFKWK